MATFIVFNLVACMFAAFLSAFPPLSAAFSVITSAISSLLEPQIDKAFLPGKLKNLLRYINNHEIFKKPYFYFVMAILISALLIANHSSLTPFRESASGPDFLTYILDNSGSMGLSGEPIHGKYKVQYAINKIIADARKLNNFGKLSLIEIGGRSEPGACNIPLLTNDVITQDQLIEKLNSIQPNGSGATDITGAISAAVRNIEEQEERLQKPNSTKQIIILTDLGHNCRTSPALNSIEAEIRRTIEKGYVSTPNENIMITESKEYINSLVVFALKSNLGTQNAVTIDPISLPTKAILSSRHGDDGTFSGETSTELEYTNDVKVLRSQGIRVVELLTDDLTLRSELFMPNENMKIISNGILFILYFWGTKYFFFLLSIADSPHLTKLKTQISSGVQREKAARPNPSGTPPRKPTDEYPPQPRNHQPQRNTTDWSVPGKEAKATGMASNAQKRGDDFDSSPQRGPSSESPLAMKMGIHVSLRWSYHYNDAPYMRLHLLWKRSLDSPKWEIKFNDKEVGTIFGPEGISDFTIKTISQSETGGITRLYIEGNPTGIFLIAVESYYKTHAPFGAKSLALAKPRVDIVSKEYTMNQSFSYSSLEDIDSWEVCEIKFDTCLRPRIQELNRPNPISRIINPQQS